MIKKNKSHTQKKQPPNQRQSGAAIIIKNIKSESNKNNGPKQGETTKKPLQKFISVFRFFRKPTIWMVIFTGALVIVNIFYNVMFKRQLDENAKEFTANHRPWVGIFGPIQPTSVFSFDNGWNGVPNVSISCVLKNGGQAPAFKAYVWTELDVQPIPSDKDEMQNQMNREVETWEKDATILNSTDPVMEERIKNLGKLMGCFILPGDTHEFTFNVGGNAIQNPNVKKCLNVWLKIHIRYEDEFKNVHGSFQVFEFQAADGRCVASDEKTLGRFNSMYEGEHY